MNNTTNQGGKLMDNTYSKEQIIDCLIAEFNHLIEEDCAPDFTEEDYIAHLKTLSYEGLIAETSTGEGFTLDEWIDALS